MNIKHIIKDNVKYHKVMLGGVPIFTSRVTISGTWSATYSSNCMEVVISGEVELNDKVDCYSITFEAGGHLTINAGARLRVWQGGIVNNDCTTVNYLTIVEDAVNDVYGEFLLHPDVTVNNHPLASVELISKSCYRYPAQANILQRFGIPMTKGGLQSITASGNHETRFYAFDYAPNAWKGIGYINPSPGYESDLLDYTKINDSFECYQMLDFVATTPGTKYTMIGRLCGNDNHQLNALGNSYRSFTNSYAGVIKTNLLLSLLAEHNISSILVGPDNTEIDASNVEQWPYIQPVYCQYLMVNRGAQFNLNLSYKDLVWDPSFEEEVIPTRGLMKGALTSSKPTEIDTALEGSGIFDNPEPVFPLELDEK